NGLKVCFLSYSQSLGAVKRPPDKKYLANLYKDLGVKWIRRLIDKIRNQNLADIIILSIHFGKEYQMFPTANQQEIASNLSDAGADVIIGHHTHVLQPPAYLVNSKGQNTFVAYSLGNFFTGQKGIYRQIGGYMSIDIEKEPGNNKSLVQFSNPKMNLTFIDSTEKEDYKLYLLKDIVENSSVIKTHVGDFDSKMIY